MGLFRSKQQAVEKSRLTLYPGFYEDALRRANIPCTSRNIATVARSTAILIALGCAHFYFKNKGDSVAKDDFDKRFDAVVSDFSHITNDTERKAKAIESACEPLVRLRDSTVIADGDDYAPTFGEDMFTVGDSMVAWLCEWDASCDEKLRGFLPQISKALAANLTF
jgi:hypothetical protein